jgi:hypothetical protein
LLWWWLLGLLWDWDTPELCGLRRGRSFRGKRSSVCLTP